MEYQNYQNVPWFRKDKIYRIIVFSNFFIPFILYMFFDVLLGYTVIFYIMTIGILLTGDVYRDKIDDSGNLKKWSLLDRAGYMMIIFVNMIFILFVIAFLGFAEMGKYT